MLFISLSVVVHTPQFQTCWHHPIAIILFCCPPPASTQSLQCVTHAKHRGGLKGEVLVLSMEFDNMKPLHCLGC